MACDTTLPLAMGYLFAGFKNNENTSQKKRKVPEACGKSHKAHLRRLILQLLTYKQERTRIVRHKVEEVKEEAIDSVSAHLVGLKSGLGGLFL